MPLVYPVMWPANSPNLNG